MSACNLETRDLLHDVARGTLTGPALVAVEEHLATCASCRAELALVRRALASLSAAPPVNTPRIAATASARAQLVTARPQRVWLAAASVVAVVGAALLATSLARHPGSSELPPVVIEFEEPDTPIPPRRETTEPVRATPRALARAELVGGGGSATWRTRIWNPCSPCSTASMRRSTPSPPHGASPKEKSDASHAHALVLCLSVLLCRPTLTHNVLCRLAPAGRRALEQRVRQRMAAVVQQRLGLTADQMRRLGDVNRDMEGQRRLLQEQERDVRVGLRAEVLRGDSASQDRVSRFVDQLIDVQRRRIDLLAREQRALASFMTPVQRAKYLALQDQLRRRMEEMRGRPGRGAQRRGVASPHQ